MIHEHDYYSLSGIILIVVYFLVITILFRIYSSNKYSEENDIKKILRYGLLFKLVIAIGYALIYDLHYNWHGDSYYYFRNASRLGDVLFKSPSAYFRMLFGFIDASNVHEIDHRLGYRPRVGDMSIFAVHRYMSIFTIIGLNNFFLSIMVLNAFLFLLNWKAFNYFRKLFPDKTKIIAIGFLFIPSATFWGSGILKDSFTYTFTLLFMAYFHKIIFSRKFGILNILKILFCAYILIELKPYILYSLLAAGFLWFGLANVYLVKNQILRVFVLPISMVVASVVGIYVLTSVMGTVGGYYSDIDTMLERAVVTQQDLKQDYYEGQAFDIGDFDATIGGAASVTPAAVTAALYRPFLWESGSLTMILSGIENFILLFLTAYVLLRAGPFFVFRKLAAEPFLVFCFVFSLMLAMGIGLSTSNFGALVRFKIPLLPFFAIALLWLRHEKIKKQD